MIAAVTVRIPSVLAQVAGGQTEIPVRAATIAGALEAMFAALPQLRVHLLDESGSVRPHVAVFHNGHSIRTVERLGETVAEGDVVTVLQAVSGG
jgi:molybdopterin converting factor small subunit